VTKQETPTIALKEIVGVLDTVHHGRTNAPCTTIAVELHVV